MDYRFVKDFLEFQQEMRSRLSKLEQKVSRVMSRIQEVEDIISQFNEVTNNLAAELADLRTQITGGMTSAEVDQVKADLQIKVDQLKALGSNPANPTDTVVGGGGVDTVPGGTGTAPQ